MYICVLPPAQFEAPLGGATAAEDLMEAFGFEGSGLEVRDPSSPKPTGEFRLNSGTCTATVRRFVFMRP